ncbi:uncharacterized protein [Epargyreus clarus]|uniref:uncharacterized protein n=1 Tax=Epargyreus clarus TaxID=520877 RepID=UPI003C2F1531
MGAAFQCTHVLTEPQFNRPDDTLVLAEGETFEGTTRLAELGHIGHVARVVAAINGIGLSVAENKTEALWFHGLRKGVEPPCMSVRVGDAVIQVGRCMRYLGLVLDSRWRFDEHFDRLVPRIHKVAGALHKLLPNLRGPREEVHRLYAGVVRSVALYGAPVWSYRLSGYRRRAAKLNATQPHPRGLPSVAIPERQILVQSIGPDLSPETVVAAMVRSGEAWDSVVAFCDHVMLAKQDAERARERADPARRRRRRRRR